LFGSAVLDENGFGTGTQREGFRVLGATLDPSIDRDFEFRAKVRRSLALPDRSGHSSMKGNQWRRLGPGEIKWRHFAEDFFCRSKAFWSITTDREKTGACFEAMIYAVNTVIATIG
jgi:hypothetical protein